MEQFNFKIPKLHKIALVCIAQLMGEPVSVALRSIIREAAEKRGIWPNNLSEQSDFEEDPSSSEKFLDKIHTR